MDTTVISVARLIELDVSRSWQEAVVVACAAGEVSGTDERTVTPADTFVSPGGTVHLTGVRGGADPDGVVALLHALLEGLVAPPELRQLVERAGSSSVAMDDLMQDLAYFDLPNRQAIIGPLATRALTLEADAQTQSEIVKLRKSQKVESRPSAPPVPVPVERPSGARRAVVLSIVALAVVAGLAAWQLGTRRTAPASIAGIPAPSALDSTPTPMSRVQSVVSATTDALSHAADAGLRAIGLAPPLAEPGAAVTPPPDAGAAARAGPGNAAPKLPTPGVIADTPPPAVPVEENPPEPPAPDAREPIVQRLEPFSSADTDVEPPVLVYPQLRTGPEPGAPPPGTPYFELVVNEAGLVEEVRLRGPAPNMQERMMVSAVKAWRFRPAMKGGEPVRYRVRFPIPR